jgi:hypothetical protein
MTTNDTKKWYYEFNSVNDKTKNETKYAILKPNRRIREDGELFFASETSRFARAGVLPKAAWNTILSNGGGTISDSEREEYGSLLSKYRDLTFELQSIFIKSEGTQSDSEKNRTQELLVEIEGIKKKIQSFEAEQINIFENTAEAKARNRTILWWVLNLAFIEKDGKFDSFFAGDSFEEKLESYDFIEESDNEDGEKLSIIRRFTYLVTLWFLGRIDSTEDFKNFDNDYMKPVDSAKEVIEESVKADLTTTSPEAPAEASVENNGETKSAESAV